jgi:hypothetical protein
VARDIKIKITGDSSDLKRAFGDAEKSAEGFGTKMGSVFGGIAKAAGALTLGGIAVAVPLVKSAVDAASDFNESLSKTQVLFGDSSKAIVAWADDAAQNLGQSRQQALDTAGTFAVFGKAMGFAGQDLVDFSKKSVGLTADLASFFNVDPAEAADAFKSALQGESEPIRKFGVLLNEESLKATALQKGLVTAAVDTKKLGAAQETAQKAARATAKALKEHGENSVEYTDAVRDQKQAEEALAGVMEGKVPQLTQAQKMQAAYLSVLDQTTDAQGDFARTSDGLANKQRIVSAAFADARQELGSAFLPAALAVSDFLLQKVIPALRGVNQWVQNVAATVRTSGWGAAFRQVADDAASGIGSIATKAWDFLRANLPGWLEAFGSWFANTAAPWLGERVAELAVVLGDLAQKGWEYLAGNLSTWSDNFLKWFNETAIPWLYGEVDVMAHILANWVLDAIPWLGENLTRWLDKLKNWFNNDSKPGAYQGGQDTGHAFAEGLLRAGGNIALALGDWSIRFVVWFNKDFLPVVIKAGAQIWVSLWKASFAGINDLFRAGWNIGVSVINGVIGGIVSKAVELAAIVKQTIWSSIPATVRRVLGIFSPSKVMATIGGQIAEGLAVGIASGSDQVAKSSQLLATAAQSGNWPTSKFGNAFPTITTAANGSVMFAGDPNSYPGSVIHTGTPVAKAARVAPRPLGLGDDEAGGGYSLSGGVGGGGGGTFYITINGVIGNEAAVAQAVADLLRRYDLARAG